MDVYELVAQARDTLTVKRVYGEPHEKDGVTIIPAAKVRGGGGAGFGRSGNEGDEPGAGGGYGMNASPAGAYVIKDGEVKWQPALDLNRVIVGGQLVAIVGLLIMWVLARSSGGRARTNSLMAF